MADTKTIEEHFAGESNAPSIVRPKRKRYLQEGTQQKRQPPYAVILHNDPKNGMDFVVGVLKKVFGYGTTKSIFLMMTVHLKGQGVIWSGTLELAELKADQIRSCGPDPNMKEQGATTLSVSIEPLPGGD